MTTHPAATIDLRSDTVTRPTPAMRRAMHDADVGDDVLDGDPTVGRLERAVAERLGKERALFFPTGTKANQAALWLLARRGSEVLADYASHVLDRECAGAAALAGVQVRAIVPRAGRLTIDAPAVAAAVAAARSRVPGPSLVCLENTHNGAGGVVTAVEETEAIAAVARERGLPVHLDGARLWNAAAALGVPEARLAAPADTVMVAFSKGLGAPIGAALAGDAAVIAEAKVVRKRLGGGMRQSGIVAAAALHGLEHHRARLRDDHARARTLATRVTGVDGARVVPPDTNIVMIDLPHPVASDVAARTGAAGVRVSAWTDARLRCVTHLDIDDAAIARAGDVIAEAIAEALANRAGGGEASADVHAYGALR